MNPPRKINIIKKYTYTREKIKIKFYKQSNRKESYREKDRRQHFKDIVRYIIKHQIRFSSSNLYI